jgi:hypothetical protein
MDKFNLIRFNDDNHAERIFVNGKYVGNISDIGFVIKNIIDIAKDLNDEYEFKETEVYVCDDFYDYDEDDEIVDTIWNFFNETEQMTEKQIELIFRKDWENLVKII